MVTMVLMMVLETRLVMVMLMNDGGDIDEDYDADCDGGDDEMMMVL